MSRVTNKGVNRIQSEPQSEAHIISPYFMTKIQKIMSVGGVALVLVLVVSFMNSSNISKTYDDVLTSALEEPEAYEMPVPEDTFEDMNEDGFEESVDVNGSGSGSVTPISAPTPVPPETTTVADIEGSLSAMDVIFAEDDIDDSALETWFTDNSGTDLLTQSYEI